MIDAPRWRHRADSGERAWTLGLRTTPARRLLLRILEASPEGLTADALVARHVDVAPGTADSVRELIVTLEQLGVVTHDRDADGREVVRPKPWQRHGHLHCRTCGLDVQLDAEDAQPMLHVLDEQRGFAADLFHVVLAGQCAECRLAGTAGR